MHQRRAPARAVLDSSGLSKLGRAGAPSAPDRRSRRRFLRSAALASGSLIGGGGLRTFAQTAPTLRLPAHLADTTGDAVLSASDWRLVQRALFSRRGFDVRPNPDFDIRADVLGRGAIDGDVVDLVSRTVAEQSGRLKVHETRPITVAWHYGWYNIPRREPGLQTVRFLGGDYASWDNVIEGRFNELKNEFGISVDALSWMTPRDNANLLSNYRRGFFQADQVETRHVALLYESTISLPLELDRIDFLSPFVQALIVQDFEQMAMFLREVRATPARVFTLDRRPVIFLFGSHTWGLLESAAQSDALDQTLQLVRESFARVYGAYPYLVGEEILRSFDAEFTENRWRRIINFDGVFSYHHATNMKSGPAVTFPVDTWYIENQVRLLREMIASIRWVANRYTGFPILLIPSLAPGFAKPGYPSLSVNRQSYSELMSILRSVHMNEYVIPYWSSHLGSALLPAPVYALGSWNEEFEGHSVFPSRFNVALNADEQRGFDIPMAIKQAFGWNHYADRPIATG